MRFNVGDIIRRREQFLAGLLILGEVVSVSPQGNPTLILLQNFSQYPKGYEYEGKRSYWEIHEVLTKEELICRKIKSMYTKRKELGYRF